MSLPLQAIDRLFSRLSATYGRDFTTKFEGVDPNAVRSSWAHELGGFTDDLGSIAWALENLPERCPNVIEFRAICRRAPIAELPRLPEPPANPERIAQEIEKLGGLRVTRREVDKKDWARRIVTNHQGGLRVLPYSLKLAKAALKETAAE